MFKMSNFFEFEIEKDGDDGIQLPSNTSVVLAKHISLNKGHNVTTRIIVSDMRSDKLYVLLYMNITNIILTGLLPLALLAFLNYHIHQGVMRFHRRREALLGVRETVLSPLRQHRNSTSSQPTNDKTQAVILFTIVLIFVLCHICLLYTSDAADE